MEEVGEEAGKEAGKVVGEEAGEVPVTVLHSTVQYQVTTLIFGRKYFLQLLAKLASLVRGCWSFYSKDAKSASVQTTQCF